MSQIDPPPKLHLLGANWQSWHSKLKLSLSQKVGCTAELVTQPRTSVHLGWLARDWRTFCHLGGKSTGSLSCKEPGPGTLRVVLVILILLVLLWTPGPMLPERAQGDQHRGLLAGLVLEQDNPGWRKASKRHLSWLWNKVNALSPMAAKTRYRALIVKTVRVRKQDWCGNQTAWSRTHKHVLYIKCVLGLITFDTHLKKTHTVWVDVNMISVRLAVWPCENP